MAKKATKTEKEPSSEAKKPAAAKKSTTAKKASPAKKTSTARKTADTNAAKTTKTSAAKKTPAKRKPAAKKTPTPTKETSKPAETSADTAEKNTYPKLADTRLEQLWFQFDELKVEALVITNPSNVRYLTNFSGENGAMFMKKDKELHFVTDRRFEKQIEGELYPFEKLHTHIAEDVWTFVKKDKAFKNVSAIAFESDHLSYSDAVSIRNKIRPFKFKPAPEMVERFTMPKAPEERVYIKEATDLCQKVFDEVIKNIKTGVTERDLAIEITYIGRKLGAEAIAFEPIVASGENTSFYWSKTGDRKIKKNDLIIFDFGFQINGFTSRIARTVAYGKATKEQSDIYGGIVNAWNAVLKGVMPGLNGTTVDDMMRAPMKKIRKKDLMPPQLGHGIGLRVEEMPIIAKGREDQIIPDSSVLVLHPGFYDEGSFGIRIADLMLITRNAGEAISTPPEELIVV